MLAKKRAWVGAWFSGLISFAGYGAIVAVLWYGGRLLANGEMDFGELTSFMLYTFTVAFSLGALSGLYEDFAKEAPSAQAFIKDTFGEDNAEFVRKARPHF